MFSVIFQSWRALAGLSVREATRSGLWWAVAAAAVAMAIAALRLGAVDEASRLKLAVVVVTSGSAFVATLLAVLLASAQLRRDLESKSIIGVLAKPTSRLGYLLGRWTGVLAWIALALVVLAAIGSGAAGILWRGHGGVPDARQVVAASDWSRITLSGEVVAIPAAQTRLGLAGSSGEGVRWRLEHLGRAPAEGFELLLRARVRGEDFDGSQRCAVEITAWPGNDSAKAQALSLDPASPYGKDTSGRGAVVLADIEDARNDLGQDWARLRLPAACIARDGSATVQLARKTPIPLMFNRADSLVVAQPGGGLFINLVRAAGVQLAIAGMLAACTLLIAMHARIAVAVLGGLTLVVAGSAVSTIPDLLEYHNPSAPTRRLLELALVVVPDFDRVNTAAQLAGGKQVTWAAVGWAWAYFGAFSTVFLGLAWFGLARHEV